MQLETETEGEFEVIVVHDREIGYPEAWELMPGLDYPLVKLLTNQDSIAGLYNQGVMSAQGKFICLMHNDVRVEKGWNVELERLAAEGNIAFPRIIEDWGDSLSRGFRPMDTSIPPSCCVMMKRSRWQELGGMNEVYKGMHFEDMDLYRRALGKRIGLVEAETQIEHRRATTRQYVDRADMNEYMLTNKVFYFDRHGLQLPIFTRRESNCKGSDTMANKTS